MLVPTPLEEPVSLKRRQNVSCCKVVHSKTPRHSGADEQATKQTALSEADVMAMVEMVAALLNTVEKRRAFPRLQSVAPWKVSV